MIIEFTDFQTILLYVSLFLLCIYLYLINSKRNNNKILFMIIILILCYLASKRYATGTDFFNMGYTYDNNCKMSLKSYFSSFNFFESSSLGIFIISKISKLFDSIQLYYGIICFLIVYPVLTSLSYFWMNKKKDFTIALSAFLFNQYLVGFNTMKQSIAVSLFFYGLRFIIEKKPKKYFFTILFAISFHQTAIIALPVYLIFNNNIKQKQKKIIYTISIILTMILILDMDSILRIFGGRWINYQSENTYATSNLSSIMYVVLLLFFSIYQKQIINTDERYKIIYLIYFIGVVLSFIGYVSVFAKRIANYFLVTEILLFQAISEKMIINNKNIGKMVTFIIIFAIFIIDFYVLKHSEVIPYTLRW